MTPEPGRIRPLYGAVAGLLAGLVAVGVGQFAASLGNQDSSPVVAVGEVAIGLAPPAVKEFAISTFGEHDKTALLTGILVLLALYAAGIGILGTRRLEHALLGLGVFAIIGLGAAGSRPGADIWFYLPTVVAAAASGIMLTVLLRNVPGRTAVAPRPPRVPRRLRPDSMFYTGPAEGEDGPAELADGEPQVPGTDGWVTPVGDGGWADEREAPGRVTQTGPERRQFLVASAAAAGLAAAGTLGGRVLAERAAVSSARAHLRFPRPKLRPGDYLPPGADLRIPGLSSFVTSNSSFYRVDTAIVLPQIDPSSWSLRIHGMVEREIEISFDQLLRRPLIETYVTLTCVSDPVEGPYVGNARWLGASLADLIRLARPQAGADQILSTSADGYTCGTPVQTVLDGRNAMLAVAMNGQALPVSHGFPVRMVVPGLYGYVSATKWVTDIKLTTFGAERAYWAQRGWSQQGPIKTESRIDVPTGNGALKPGVRQVAGVAWAQHKGIEAVEVRADGGGWHEARLAAVPGIDTWRQWVWDWPATAGNHVLEARATDKTGYTQTSVLQGTVPNGATGYPQLSVNVS